MRPINYEGRRFHVLRKAFMRYVEWERKKQDQKNEINDSSTRNATHLPERTNLKCKDQIRYGNNSRKKIKRERENMEKYRKSDKQQS